MNFVPRLRLAVVVIAVTSSRDYRGYVDCSCCAGDLHENPHSNMNISHTSTIALRPICLPPDRPLTIARSSSNSREAASSSDHVKQHWNVSLRYLPPNACTRVQIPDKRMLYSMAHLRCGGPPEIHDLRFARSQRNLPNRGHDTCNSPKSRRQHGKGYLQVEGEITYSISKSPLGRASEVSRKPALRVGHTWSRCSARRKHTRWESPALRGMIWVF